MTYLARRFVIVISIERRVLFLSITTIALCRSHSCDSPRVCPSPITPGTGWMESWNDLDQNQQNQ